MFQSEGAHLTAGWTQKNDTFALARMCEIRVFTEKTIAGMYGISCGISRCFENGRLIEVAFGGGPGANGYGRICLCDVQRVPVGFGIYGYWRNAQFSQSTNDPASDDASIRNKDLMKHFNRQGPRSIRESAS